MLFLKTICVSKEQINLMKIIFEKGRFKKNGDF